MNLQALYTLIALRQYRYHNQQSIVVIVVSLILMCTATNVNTLKCSQPEVCEC